uniref:basic salivary proline-rich protein 1-like n=1 Tax=Macaca mulatta TaxID=9544 RepID=UPI0003ABC298|nr:basic salivary proline-rich protein 1-like [Macaca mulatta]
MELRQEKKKKAGRGGGEERKKRSKCKAGTRRQPLSKITLSPPRAFGATATLAQVISLQFPRGHRPVHIPHLARGSAPSARHTPCTQTQDSAQGSPLREARPLSSTRPPHPKAAAPQGRPLSGKRSCGARQIPGHGSPAAPPSLELGRPPTPRIRPRPEAPPLGKAQPRAPARGRSALT